MSCPGGQRHPAAPVLAGQAYAPVRRRWWTPEGSSVDLTFGPVASQIAHAGRHGTVDYGFTGAAYLVGGDILNCNGRVDLILTGRRPIVGTSVGLGLGSRPAVYATIIVLMLARIALAGGPST